MTPEAFRGLPVICALTESDLKQPALTPFIKTPPDNWILTRPGERIVPIGNFQTIYVGHKRSWDVLWHSRADFRKTLETMRRDHDGLRWLFSGHTHHQVYLEGKIIKFVNPGAVCDSFDGSYEFAIINTSTDETVFCRILASTCIKQSISIAVISDSLDISELDTTFWQRLSQELRRRDVRWIIHCGNISVRDIGRPELEEFTIYFGLRPDQKLNGPPPENWRQIDPKDPVVVIDGYRLYVSLNLGPEISKQSEFDMNDLCQKLRQDFPDIRYVCTGFTNEGLYEEGEQIRIINPGDAVKNRNFVVICLPRNEITFGHVPIDPLPDLSIRT